MIKTEGLIKTYIAEEVQTKALNEIDLRIEQGEFVSIMGPSGCGKSSLLNVLGLIDSPTSGEYYLQDQEVSKLSEDQLSDIRKESIG